jgi:hypothetical protein
VKELNGYGGLLGAVLLLLVCFAVAAVDLFASFSRGRVLTVTEVVQNWSRQWPVVAFALGFLMGHLFFPTWVYPGREEAPTPLPPVTIRNVVPADQSDLIDPLASGSGPVTSGQLDCEDREIE